jgi:hypothetical protein
MHPVTLVSFCKCSKFCTTNAVHIRQQCHCDRALEVHTKKRKKSKVYPGGVKSVFAKTCHVRLENVMKRSGFVPGTVTKSLVSGEMVVQVPYLGTTW